MPNKNLKNAYRNGKAKEQYWCEKLRKAGFDIAQRSAGSHSPIDIWAVNKTTKVIKLVQCKPLSLSEKKRKELEFELNWLNGMFRVEFEVI